MNRLPILILDKDLLFPDCYKTLSLDLKQSRIINEVIIKSLRDFSSQLLIVPISSANSNKKRKSRNEPEKKKNLSNYGVKAEISSVNGLGGEELVKNQRNSKQVQITLRGLERIKIVSFNDEELMANFEVINLAEKKYEPKDLASFSRKFFYSIPQIIEKAKISSYQQEIKIIPRQEERTNELISSQEISKFLDMIVQYSSIIPFRNKLKIFSLFNVEKRFEALENFLKANELENDLEEQAQKEIHKDQEEYFLKKKLAAIRKRLKSGKDWMINYLDAVKKNPYPENVRAIVEEEIERYDSTQENSSESAVIKQYLDWLVKYLPWWQESSENNDLQNAREILDSEHFGLEKVKEKIIEYLAARQRSAKVRAKNLLFYGPPGTGKTSFARSVAKALNRPFVKVSLGGMHDEAEIRGNRRTYVAAMPGRIIKAMKEAGKINPVIMLDEIDKISSTGHGDPRSALLELLDPQQNHSFSDNYLGEITYDLSHVIFIATANDPSSLPSALINRLSLISFRAYSEQEKLSILKGLILPRKWQDYKLTKEQINFSEDSLREIIRFYTYEAGIRQLEINISNIFDKFCVKLGENPDLKVTITKDNLDHYLKTERVNDFTEKNQEELPGICTGLAYTEVGGDILKIETVLSDSEKSDQPKVTGNLGKIMQESIVTALGYIKSNHNLFGINSELLKTKQIHIHVPSGAVPKDGPSAGVVLTLSMISAMTGKIVSREIGITGEITLNGTVGKIGGLPEKLLAAKRSGLKKVIIPQENVRELINDVPSEVSESLEVYLVKNFSQVWRIIQENNPKEFLYVKAS